MSSYTLTVEPKGSYLHAVARGPNTRDTVLGYFRELRDACRTRDCYRVLIEERLDGPRFPPDALQALMAEVVAWAGATFEVVAYVDVHAEDDTIRRLAGQVVEPGMTIGIFATVAEAERWIRAWGGPGKVDLPRA